VNPALGPADVTVVIATRDRREQLLATLARLAALPEAPPVIVVDNRSTDGTAAAVAEAWPDVTLIDLPHNQGAAARTVGVRVADTPLVAFADDDSWWAPGALARATDHFATHPRLAVLAAQIRVEPGGRLDPASAEMGRSPLKAERPLPGPAVLGFVACGAVVRREAYLEVGGFAPLLHFPCEERLLALDLAAAGWDLAYAHDVVAHHQPAPTPKNGGDRRRALIQRNDLLITWMRRPWRLAARATLATARRARRDLAARAALLGTLRRLPAALAERHRLPREIEARMRRLEGGAAAP